MPSAIVATFLSLHGAFWNNIPMRLQHRPSKRRFHKELGNDSSGIVIKGTDWSWLLQQSLRWLRQWLEFSEWTKYTVAGLNHERVGSQAQREVGLSLEERGRSPLFNKMQPSMDMISQSAMDMGTRLQTHGLCRYAAMPSL